MSMRVDQNDYVNLVKKVREAASKNKDKKAQEILEKIERLARILSDGIQPGDLAEIQNLLTELRDFLSPTIYKNLMEKLDRATTKGLANLSVKEKQNIENATKDSLRDGLGNLFISRAADIGLGT
jgi:hypothetical protein